MTRLTEEMVARRTRASDLATVKKFNCWGLELQDISLLRRLTNVEVLSLSVNKISTLADFQYCKKLKELYVRKNDIQNLNEICYLKDLPFLRALWLAGNPCSASDSNYRMTVIRNLPELERLDDVKIELEERQDAMKRGRLLLHPEECDGNTTPPPSPPAVVKSPSSNRSSDHEQDSRKSYSPDYEVPANNNVERRYSQPNEQYDSRNYQNARRPNDIPYETNDNDNGGSVGSFCGKCSNPLSPSHNGSEPNIKPSNINTNMEDVEGEYNSSENAKVMYSNYSNNQYDRPQHPIRREKGDSPRRASANEVNNMGMSSPQRGGYNHEEDLQQLCDRSYRQCENNQRYPTRRSVTRYQNSNILSAVLCLIRELDYASLEVVGIAVRCRMDEFED